MLYIFTKSTASAGGSRQRAFNVATFLKKAGYESRLVIPPIYRKDIPRNQARREYLSTIFSLRKNDVVLLQNPIFNIYFVIAMCLTKIVFRPTLVFDFDDATWVQNPVTPRIFAFFCDKAIVASHYLATWKNIKGKPTLLMPNLVDYALAQEYSKSVSKESTININEKVVLGWIGDAPASMNNLKLLLPVFTKLKEKKLPVVFKIIGTLGDSSVTEAFKKTGIEVDAIDTLSWGTVGEIQKVNACFDIGLCPLEQNESNEARCSLKVLDYMVAGIPVVISPIGENNHFITNNQEGFLPKTEDEWVEKLELLIKDAELRKTMGSLAQEKIKNNYSYQVRIQEYIIFLNI
jgi:glycosyltransferase involved in cell wall biosynthesis